MIRFVERAFVWAGGGVFVVSLAYSAYSFLIRWDDGRAAGGWTAAAFDAVLLGVFAAHHSGFARAGVKEWLAKHVPERLLRSTYVWIAALLFVLVCAAWRRVGGDVHHTRGRGALAHAAVQLVGLGFIATSVATIDPLELAGIRQRQRDAADRPSPGAIGEEIGETWQSFQVTGPYRFVRHPLYFGWLLIVLGPAHLTGDRLAFAGFTTLYLILAIPWEERSLTDDFGAEYERYKERVRWRMIPFLF